MLDDPIGMVMLSLMISAPERALEEHKEIMAATRAARLVCALQLHRLDHEGRWPDRLTDLVPNILSELPSDPFRSDNATFGYRLCERDGFVLWSVYRNGHDDGGVRTLDQPQDAEDLVFGPAIDRLRREFYEAEHTPAGSSD